MVIRGRVRRAVVHVRGTACMVAWLRCDAMLDGERRREPLLPKSAGEYR